MGERYRVGSTIHNRHTVHDAQQDTLVALAVTSGRAEQIVNALNRADRRDRIAQEFAQDVVGSPTRFIDQGNGKLIPLVDEDARHPYELADERLSRRISTQADQLIQIRKYLEQVHNWLITEVTATQPDPLPALPWRDQ